MEKHYKLISSMGEEITVPEHVIVFLAGLDEKDLNEIRGAVEFITTLKTMTSVMRWVIYGFLVTTAAVLSIWTSARSLSNGH